jgi:glycosyltransferase involved in cell wall biosynthesis
MSIERVLLISYLFPPAGGIGVQRALSFARYLPDCGYEVHVLKASNAAAPVMDPALLRYVPRGTTVHTAFTPELPFGLRQTMWRWMSGGRKPDAATGSVKMARRSWKGRAVDLARRVLAPEPEVVWVPFALRRAKAIVRRFRIDAVVVTAPPFSAFLVGNALKRQFPQLKLISDFRDDWLRFYIEEFAYQKNEFVRRRANAIERETVERSDRVVATTETTRDQMRARYPDQDPAKFVLIPNGYDPEAFRDFHARPHEGDKILVCHMGTVYSASSPRYYLDVLDGLPEAMRAAFETRFIGRITAEERPFLEGRRTAVESLGFMPQAQALRAVEDADYLLLTMTDAPSLPGKLFEYLAIGKPILGIASAESEVSRILRATGAGRTADPSDGPAIQRLIAEIYEHRRQGRNGFQPNRDAIRRFERPNLVRDFAEMLKDI